MARKLFISFLGTGMYEECVYFNAHFQASPSRFIQYATLEMLRQDGNAPEAVRIFVTNKAEQTNWSKTITSRHDFRTDRDIPYYGLESVIDNVCPDVKAVHVPDGGNEAEMWEIFQKVYGEIEDGDELYIDLTHAFRYLPMLMLVLSNYAKFLKNVSVKSLSYGNWEARDKNTNRAPIVDLMPITQLQDWTSAISEYLEHGYPESIKQQARNYKLWLLKSGNKITNEAKVNDKMATAIEKYAMERLTCRGIAISKGDAAKELYQKISDMENDNVIVNLRPLLEQIRERIVVSSDVLINSLDAAQWCYDKGLYQQAITLLQEGFIGYVCQQHGWDIADKDKRNLVTSAFAIKAFNIQEDKWTVKDEEKESLRALLNDSLLEDHDLVNIFSDISNKLRNDFNHAGFRDGPLPPQTIKKNIGKDLVAFKQKLLDEKSVPAPSGLSLPKVFLNVSNHSSALWSKEQMTAAKEYGTVVDFPFPDIPAEATATETESIAEKTLTEILRSYQHTTLTVHVMGEMTFTFQIVSLLKSYGIKCLASTTERDVEETGETKISHFRFVRFREY
jgi:CRISPR-associated Csx2 family protein